MKAEVMTAQNRTIEVIEIKTLDDLMHIFNKYGGELILTNNEYEGWSYLYESDLTIIVFNAEGEE